MVIPLDRYPVTLAPHTVQVTSEHVPSTGSRTWQRHRFTCQCQAVGSWRALVRDAVRDGNAHVREAYC